VPNGNIHRIALGYADISCRTVKLRLTPQIYDQGGRNNPLEARVDLNLRAKTRSGDTTGFWIVAAFRVIAA
jgi:hypothetical protein